MKIIYLTILIISCEYKYRSKKRRYLELIINKGYVGLSIILIKDLNI